MANRTRSTTIAAIALIAIAAIAGGWLLFINDDGDPQATASTETPVSAQDGIVMPELSGLAVQGRLAFGENCARCHGENGGGTNQGPPLIHPIYEPSHHSDVAFVLAAQNGSRAHHWRFGDMPPQPQVGETEIAAIIQFVREVQRANGIR